MARIPNSGLENAAVGTVIRHLRQSLGWSQGQLSERLDVSYQQVQKYETGQNRIAFTTFLRLAAALEVSSQDLLTMIETEIGQASPARAESGS